MPVLQAAGARALHLAEGPGRRGFDLAGAARPDVLARIADHPAQKIDALLPASWKAAREREAGDPLA